MENSTRTIYGSYVQTCLLTRSPVIYMPYTTLNEKLAINASILPSSVDLPSLSYYVVGNGGHQLAVSAGGVPKPEPVQHRGTDASLYNQLPFVIRAVNNDLSPTLRARYVLRRLETHNGIDYVVYYGRRLDKTNLVPSMKYRVVANGETSTTPFVPNSSHLHPTPPTVSNTGVNTVDGDYTTASAVIDLVMTADDMTEFLNVADVLFDDDGYAIISEIGLCTGVDKIVTVNAFGGGTFQYNEAIGVQIISHIPAMIPAKYSNEGTDISLDIGSTEPLWSLGSV